jgi:hypothetical protein
MARDLTPLIVQLFYKSLAEYCGDPVAVQKKDPSSTPATARIRSLTPPQSPQESFSRISSK